MGSLTVLLFGPAKDAMDGATSFSVDLQSLPLPVRELRDAVIAQEPKLRFVMQNAIFAINNILIPQSHEENTMVPSFECEVVLVPPVSGG